MATADIPAGYVPGKLGSVPEPWIDPPWIEGDNDFRSVTDKVCRIAENPRPPVAWFIGFVFAASLAGMLGAMIGYLIITGVGVWGNQNSVSWGFPIVNFVFWVGIGHAGTLISAILFLFRQHWRTSINRFAEAMTIFAVVCAGTFPGIHIGRVWFAYYLFPIPDTRLYMWPQFRSPLLWDVFAVGTYATVSLLFWYMGMIPDLATLRDRARHPIRRMAYGILSVGWIGSATQWRIYEKAYALLAALATPLVLSVHTIVSFDFAVSQLPGWHTTIFPPYFVAGAVFSGFGMVLTLMIPAREWFGLKDIVTMRHIDCMCKIIIATGSMVGFAYLTEFFIAWYGGNPYEQFAFINRAFGPTWWAYWTMVTCNVISPQLFWFGFVRRNPMLIFIISIFVNIGMWFERYVIILSLERTFIPGSWQSFVPTWIDLGMLVGSFGLFFTLFLLFCRFLPIVAMSEVKQVMAHVDGNPHLPGKAAAAH
ncbi:Polysulfide reductase, NrfD [Botrimarina colliarenosi]|uniref:Polysulfide reductase, NrfD n=1 Tax=Botrimarina colliarenosi TaxID=2528001 RepID=A0A5C6ANW7_9BACT|nr:NrfD/PsrC family molybdoenzyme membrane anchor subunit [Botrimarina colliarenosi]TWT99863.1 Polysulfide reductase, NrfD [Botrimarina colliarenosi]